MDLLVCCYCVVLYYFLSYQITDISTLPHLPMVLFVEEPLFEFNGLTTIVLHNSVNVPNGPLKILDFISYRAQFSRAVTELQITGLLRMTTKQRTDYVQRGAFGL